MSKWRYEPTLYAVQTDEGRRSIAGSVGAAGDSLMQRDAIGRLLAAAPELLEQARRFRQALRQLRAGTWTDRDLLAMESELAAVITKADGAS